MPITRMINRFPELIVTGNSRTAAALDKCAADLVTGAMSRSRHDTGLMMGSWTWIKINAFTRMVYNPVYYTIFNEYGTIYMSAQPMIRPAMEEVVPGFIQDVRNAWYG